MFENFTFLDVFLASPVLAGLWRGLYRGLNIEFFSLLLHLMALYLNHLFINAVSANLAFNFGWDVFNVQAFFFMQVNFLFIFLLHVACRYLFERVRFFGSEHGGNLKDMKHLLGSIVGMLRYGLIFSAFFSCYVHLNKGTADEFSPQTLEKSYLYTPMTSIAPFLYPVLEFKPFRVVP